MNYLKLAKENISHIISLRRELHQIPEPGHSSPLTCEFIARTLKSYGVSPVILKSGGVTALIGSHSQKTILLRADMDALPITEKSGLNFASRTIERSHACGHDLHTAMLLYAAKMLKDNENNLKGQVKLMFQPGEEVLTGARAMIADGILQCPSVDAAFAMHVNTGLEAGVFYYSDGVTAPSSDFLKITVNGIGSHGARPHEGIDPINVGSHIIIALQSLISRELPPHEKATLTFGTFHAGTAENIIPAQAVLTGTLRAFSEPIRKSFLKRISEICEHTAKAFGASVQLENPAFTKTLLCDSKLTQFFGRILSEIHPSSRFSTEITLGGSEDFSELSHLVPSFYAILGAGKAQDGYIYGIHHPQVTFDESAMAYGAAAYAASAEKWLLNHNI